MRSLAPGAATSDSGQKIVNRTPWRATAALVGLLLVLFSFTMLPPLFVSWYYTDGEREAFLGTFWATFSVGFLCWFPLRGARMELRNRQGFLVVVLLWVAASLLSALPFMLAHRPSMSLTDAVFEAISGLTTTGATALAAIDGLPQSILYYRAQLNFLGGMGIVVLAVAVLPMFGIGGMQLYKAETPGPMKDEKLTPRIRETAKRLWYVYVGIVVLCAVAFWLAGMTPFDAVAHSFSTISLGGFSTHGDSIGYFQSAAIELVAGAFTLLAGINFALHFLAWRTRSLTPIVHNPEVRFYLLMVMAIVALACAHLYWSGAFPLWESLYHGFFQSLSIMTDNGLVTAGYPGWPAPVVLLLVFASFFGGCVGSTCGGIKAFRFLLLFKQGIREVKRLIHPAAHFVVKIGDKSASDRVVEAVWGFYFLYVFAYCLLALAVVTTGVDLITAFGATAACLNNMGAGLGETASSFGGLNDAAKWVLAFAMILGRLELFPVLLLFSREAWE